MDTARLTIHGWTMRDEKEIRMSGKIVKFSIGQILVQVFWHIFFHIPFSMVTLFSYMIDYWLKYNEAWSKFTDWQKIPPKRSWQLPNELTDRNWPITVYKRYWALTADKIMAKWRNYSMRIRLVTLDWHIL